MSYNEHLTAGLANLWDCSAREATERIAPKRKRVSQNSNRGDIPWTAARCSRLLRTITSRVNILRKQAKSCVAGSLVRNAQSQSCRDVEQDLHENTPISKKGTKSPANDPVWVPGAQLGASSRTYGNKSKSHAGPTSRKPTSGFSTPFVKRLLNAEAFSTAKPSCSIYGDHESKRPSKRMRQLPVQLASSNEEAQRNLVTAFSSVLIATNQQPGPERTGARSLMSSCLRQVPKYIDLEKEDFLEDDADNEDVTSSVYADLESLGTNRDGGWSGLREVVRSQCVHHICAAIEDNLIHESRVQELVNACSKNGAVPEADRLLQTWLGKAQSGASQRMDGSSIAMLRLAGLRSTHDALELYLRRHAWLVDSDRVWISDVLRPGSIPMKDLIKALIRGPGQDAALRFLEIAVLKDVETSSAASLPIFTRLAGLLASIALTQAGSNTDNPTQYGLQSIVNRIAVSILQCPNGRMQRSAVHPFVIANTLLRLATPSTQSWTTAPPLAQSIATLTAHQNGFVKLACNVAQHVFRFSDADELESLLLTTSGLLNPLPECSNEDQETLSRIAFEIAFTYSEHTGIEIDHHFANSVSANKRSSGGLITQTPRCRVQVSGFKWEEGLCEWVAATPLPLSKDSSTQPDNLSRTPKQLPTPKDSSPKRVPRSSVLVLPSSPDIIAGRPARSPERQQTTPSRAQPSRPALKERSANQPPPKQTHDAKDQERRISGLLKPMVPKQVHLKVERAKKAALLAQAAVQAPPKQLKRYHSVTSPSNEDATDRHRAVTVNNDELGVITPARKKPKSVLMPRGVRHSSARTSLPARTLDVDAMSDDELGL